MEDREDEVIQDWVAAAQDGDPVAHEFLWAYLEKRLRPHVGRLPCKGLERHEVLHETLKAVLRAVIDSRVRGSLVGYAVSTLRKTFAFRARTEGRFQRVLQVRGPQEDAVPDENPHKVERADLLDFFRGHLSAGMQELFDLKRKGLPSAEIARKLGISRDALESRWWRILRRLRRIRRWFDGAGAKSILIDAAVCLGAFQPPIP